MIHHVFRFTDLFGPVSTTLPVRGGKRNQSEVLHALCASRTDSLIRE